MAYTNRIAVQTAHPATLVVNLTNSRCGHCGEDALPEEFYHATIPGWVRQRSGCNYDFVVTASEYRGPDIRDAVIRLRPDLTFIGTGHFNAHRKFIHEGMTA